MMKKLLSMLVLLMVAVTGAWATTYNLTVTQKPTELYNPFDDLLQINVHSEEGVDITFYLSGVTELSLGTTYTYADMDSNSKVSISGSNYYLVDARITKTKNDELVHFEIYAADEVGNYYNADYQEQPAEDDEPVGNIVTWDGSNLTDLDVSSTRSYKKGGVTLSANADMNEARWHDYGDPEWDGIGFDIREPGGFTFTAPTGRKFVKIEMMVLDYQLWGEAIEGGKLGSGWPSGPEAAWALEDSKTITWTGDGTSTVGFLTGIEDDFMGAPYVSKIVFTLEEPAPEPPTGVSTIKVTPEKGAWYDLNGRRVTQPTKGIYIKDGNKVVIK